nr:MAG TPA: hypothetical protein [Caudoviricetes sp.]
MIFTRLGDFYTSPQLENLNSNIFYHVYIFLV